MKLYSVLVALPIEIGELFRLNTFVAQYKKWLKIQGLKLQVSKERQELAELPDYLLKDIGIHKADAYLESQRAIDDLPEYRVRKALRADDRFR